MLKKTIEFEDLDGNKVSEDFYFNLNKAELAEMELSQDGGLQAYLTRLIKSNDGGDIIKTFKDILMASVGKRSEDNRRFIKNDEVRAEFEQSDAYSTLFMELVTDADASADFIKAIVPKDLVPGESVTNLVIPDEDPDYVKENRDPTPAELQAMNPEQLADAFRRKNSE